MDPKLSSSSSSTQHSPQPMEEETQPTKPMDPTLQKKHQAMLDRLSNRHQSRASAASATSTTTSSTAAFLSQFSESKQAIESQLSNSSNYTSDPDRLKSHLADISSSISSLEQLVAENSYSIPSYELRSSLKSISDLKHTLENLYPKKKFSFKNKPNPKPAQPDNPTPEPEKTAPNPTPQHSVRILQIRDSPGIRSKSNETLTTNFKSLDIGEFTLSSLDGCEVRLIGSVNALFFNKLKGCKVYAGPVMGSILIEEVEDCVFVLASHQIRIHWAKACDFYLRVRSRPIIEDCGGVRFAPYCLRYEGIEEDLKEAGLEEETGNWNNVDDFKWLRAVKSPNWSVLEESERIGSVKIEYLGGENEEALDCGGMLIQVQQ